MTPLRPARRPRWLLTLVCVCTLAAAQPAPPEGPSGTTPKRAVQSKREMVATANPIATAVGYRILRQGGTAVDATIAMQMVLNLVEPQSSGIGGGAFMLAHDARSHLLSAYDGRETAPAAATPERFLDADGKPQRFFDAVVGGKSVGVPGTLRMLALAHRRHGKLRWADLFEPAIHLAETGFAVSPRLHAAIVGEKTFAQERARAYFSRADGKPLEVGDILKNPPFAATLRRIANEGADAFYVGALATDIVQTANSYVANPGDLTEADLASYKAKARTPICGVYRHYTVCGMPPPSAGGVTLLELLGLLDRFDLAATGVESLQSVHLFSEAGRLAFADRDQYLADPDFVAIPEGLTDLDYLRRRSMLIQPNVSIGHASPGLPEVNFPLERIAYGSGNALEFPSTSHLSVVDRDGNAVAMTTTIENAFGSTLMTKGGFLLNNQLTDFSFVPVVEGKIVANRVEAGKRPRSAMAPTIVYDAQGQVLMIVGSPGGGAIINYVAKTLIGVLDWHLDPQAAIDLPNIGSRNGPTELESGTRLELLASPLRAMGHDVRISAQTSGVQAIVRTRDGWIGGADSRREGVVLGD